MKALRQNDAARGIAEFGRVLSMRPPKSKSPDETKEANDALQSQVKN